MPGKANEQQQREWLVEYEKLKQNLPENETICFMDGVHPTHNVQPAYGWIKKGERRTDLNTFTGRVDDGFSANKHDKHVIRFVKNISINLFGYYILRFELFISAMVLFLGEKCGSQELYTNNLESR